MTTARVIIRQRCRILTPKEANKLIENLNPMYRVLSLAALHTGLRQVELWALIQNPHWYHASSRVIDLPEEGAAHKPMMTTTDRTIRLTEGGCKAIEALLAIKPPERDSSSYGRALKRAAK
jgi:hypothetical protein